MTLSADEKAHLLLIEIKEALDNGTLHYNRAGVLLPSICAVVECLLNEGEVMFEPRHKDPH